MKKLVILLIAISVLACTEDSTVSEETIYFEQVANELTLNLDQIAKELRSQNADFSDRNAVYSSSSKILKENYEAEEVLADFNKSFEGVGARATNQRTTSKAIELTEYQMSLLSMVDELWTEATSLDDYKHGLELIRSNIVNDELIPIEEKNIAILYLTSYVVGINFMLTNSDLIRLSDLNTVNGRTTNWWDDWGKCASGIVGGAGMSALGGCGIGAQVGLGVASIPGCGVGAIIGGIFGGLAGASAACGGGSPVCIPSDCRSLNK